MSVMHSNVRAGSYMRMKATKPTKQKRDATSWSSNLTKDMTDFESTTYQHEMRLTQAIINVPIHVRFT